jgi:hypothetical protein
VSQGLGFNRDVAHHRIPFPLKFGSEGAPKRSA